MPAPPGIGQSGPGGTTAGGTNAGPSGGTGPTSVADAVAQMGETNAQTAVTTGQNVNAPTNGLAQRGGRSLTPQQEADAISRSWDRGGDATSPIAAAMMLDGDITNTGNPNSPQGELSPEQANQIASLVNMSRDNSAVQGLVTSMPVVGNVVGLANALGLISFDSNTPGIEGSIAGDVAEGFGGGEGLGGQIAAMLGFSDIDPGVQAAIDAQMAGRMEGHNAVMAGLTDPVSGQSTAAPGERRGNGLDARGGTAADPTDPTSGYWVPPEYLEWREGHVDPRTGRVYPGGVTRPLAAV